MLRSIGNDERGSVATIFAILLPVLLGFTAMGVETGYWFSERQRLQIISDSAAYSALIAYADGASVADAQSRGVTEARASGFEGDSSAVVVTVIAASGTRPAYSTANLQSRVSLFLTRLFLPSEVLPVAVQSFASLAATQTANCLMALDAGMSRAIQIAASVNITLKKCVASSNSNKTDSIWLEGTAKLTADCISTPGGVNWNGGAVLTLRECTNQNYPRVTQTDPYTGVPFWGSPAIPNSALAADASINQGRYGPGMPGGATLKPGRYAKMVEIAGDVKFEPGIYYFSEGFRAVSGGKINGDGVTMLFNPSKTIDVAQSVPWRLTAPTSGPTQGIALMGDPTSTSNNNVRLIGALGNVQGVIYFRNQRVQTESGPNGTPARCTTLVAKSIDIRGDAAIVNDCAGAGGAASGGGKVRLVPAPPA